MAEMSDKEIIDFLERLKEANPAMAKYINLQNRANKLFERGNKDMDSWLKEIDKTSRSLKLLSGDTLGKFAKGLKNTFESVNDTKEALDELDEIIKNTGDTAAKADLEAKREILARRAATNAIQAASLDFTKALSKNVVGGIAATTGKFVTGLQNNVSATELSSTLMTGAIDLAAGAASGAGQAVAKMGDAAMAVGKPGGPLQKAGLAFSLLGTISAGLAEGMGRVAKFGVEVLSKEVEKTVTSFNNMSSAGALFADGMTGMRAAANGAGLTLEQFSKVVTTNADALAGTGMGVGEASRKMGAVSEELGTTVGKSGKTLRRELLQLGVSFEEQAALSAEVMADMRRGRSSQLGDNKAIAQQTAEYAGNLKTIAAITGEDAKSKMQEQRRAATQVAFRLKLQELEQKQPGITQKMLASMATMDETSRTALMQQMTIGAVVDKSANVMMAGSEAYSQKINGMAQLAESGAFTTEEAQKIQAEANDKMQGDLRNFREIGIAGMTGSLQDLNSAISGQIANMDKVTASAVESSQRLVEQQKAATDKLTGETMAAAEAAQKLKTSIEKALTPAIAEFAKISHKMLSAVQRQIDGILKESKAEDEGGWWSKHGHDILSYGGTALGGTIGAIGTAWTGPGSVGGAITGGMVGQRIGESLAEWLGLAKKEPGMALGGIAEGPAGGYLEKLHGTEAVIPLADGKSVPVNLDISSIARAITDSGVYTTPINTSANAMRNITTDRLMTPTESSSDVMREQVSLLTEIKELLTSSNGLQQQYVYNTYQ